jgi:ribosome-binding factor A
MNRRLERINETIRTELGNLLLKDVSDPRLSGIITITEVNTSPDLRNAQVLVSVLGDETLQNEALEGMKSAASYLRRSLRDRLLLRNTPFLTFKLDHSAAVGDKLLKLIKKANSHN